MKTLTRLFAAAFAAGAIGAVGEAAAHGMWIAPQGEGYVVLHGHGDATKADAYDPSLVKQAMAFGADGKPITVKIERAEKSVNFLPATQASSVAATLNNGLWAKSRSRGWVREGLSTAPDALEAGYSLKLSKFYARPGADFARTLGQGLEIVPLADPTTVKPGAKLTLRLLVDGLPVVGANVNTDFLAGEDAKARDKTDAKGEVTITVPKASFAGVEVNYFHPKVGDPEVNGTIYDTTLTFAVGGK